TLVTLLWDPSFRIPREYPLSIDTADRASAVFVRFNSGGRTLAVGRQTRRGYHVYLGAPTDLGTEPDLVTNSPIAWHASEVGVLAWIVTNDDGTIELHTGSVNPLTGSLMNDRVVTALDAPARIVRWDSTGFIIDDGRQVHALDQSGRLLWSRAGSSLSATPSLVVVAVPEGDTGTSRWSIIDRATGDPADVDITSSFNDLTVVASRDLDIIAAVSGNESRSTLTVGGPDLVTKRIVQVDADVTPIGFTTSNTYMVFEANGTNDLIFVNWRTGATQTLGIPEIYEVLALDLG
ncbi:MAG: hypothetical protein M3094_04785, partial [Actinomycetia bacterium]|nr:hypothetical protein [Actinomycetes bacterium]